MVDTDNRRYSDEELALIVRRASELQDRAGEADGAPRLDGTVFPSPNEGLTLEAVREIAEGVGLESRFVDEAAASLPLDLKRSGLDRLMGGPIFQQVRSTLEGELAESARADFVDLIRQQAGHDGEVREVLGAVEWRSVGRMTRTTVALDPGEGSVTVRVREDASGLAAFTWIGSIAAGLVAGGIVIDTLQPASVLAVGAILAAGGLAGAGVARSIWSRATRGLRHRAERLRDEIGRFLRG